MADVYYIKKIEESNGYYETNIENVIKLLKDCEYNEEYTIIKKLIPWHEYDRINML